LYLRKLCLWLFPDFLFFLTDTSHRLVGFSSGAEGHETTDNTREERGKTSGNELAGMVPTTGGALQTRAGLFGATASHVVRLGVLAEDQRVLTWKLHMAGFQLNWLTVSAPLFCVLY
jgi:hypothetical protein